MRSWRKNGGVYSSKRGIKDRTILQTHLQLIFSDSDDTVGHGVLIEAFFLFWEKLLANNTIEETEYTIPMGPHLTCEDYVSIERIITHQFVQCSIFPARFTQASIQQAVIGEISSECLVSSFLQLLPPRERDIIRKGMNDVKVFPQGDIIAILEYFNINKAPTTENLQCLLPSYREMSLYKSHICCWSTSVKVSRCVLGWCLIWTNQSNLYSLPTYSAACHWSFVYGSKRPLREPDLQIDTCNRYHQISFAPSPAPALECWFCQATIFLSHI